MRQILYNAGFIRQNVSVLGDLSVKTISILYN